MVDVKVEEVWDEKRSGSGVAMSSTRTNENKQRQIAMKSVCMVHDVPYQRLL